MQTSIKEQRHLFTQQLVDAAIPEAERKVDLYLSHALQCPIFDLPLSEKEINPEHLKKIKNDILRLSAHEPLQYILGETAFRELDLLCDERALVPRCETEQLIDLIPNQTWTHIIDVGTGTGCIALATAKRFPHTRITAIDTSPDALTLARANAQKNNLPSITWKKSDLLTDEPNHSADLIIANLPYISTDEMHALPADVLRYEPHLALHSGPTGMELIKTLLLQAHTTLQDQGKLFLEIGETQGKSLSDFAHKLGYRHVTVHQDLSDRERFLSGTKHG